MILFDTNVVSELMRESPEPAVEAWVVGQPPYDLFFSSVGEAELRYGAAILPAGRRRETLFSRIDAVLREAFGDRVLNFDRAAARAYGDVAAMRRSSPRNARVVKILRDYNAAMGKVGRPYRGARHLWLTMQHPC